MSKRQAADPAKTRAERQQLHKVVAAYDKTAAAFRLATTFAAQKIWQTDVFNPTADVVLRTIVTDMTLAPIMCADSRIIALTSADTTMYLPHILRATRTAIAGDKPLANMFDRMLMVMGTGSAKDAISSKSSNTVIGMIICVALGYEYLIELDDSSMILRNPRMYVPSADEARTLLKSFMTAGGSLAREPNATKLAECVRGTCKHTTCHANLGDALV